MQIDNNMTIKELEQILENKIDSFMTHRDTYELEEIRELERIIKERRSSMENKSKIKEFNISWLAIKNACRTTISLEDSKQMPKDEWKKKLLICRHSPIRKGTITWEWESIPYAISTHYARHHIGCEKWISSSREDRTGIDRTERTQMDMVRMQMEANIEALMNISERRLCMQADKTTREYWIDLLEVIKKWDENVYWSCVPQCVAHGGCIELFSDCKYFEKFAENLTKEELIDVKKRYDKYNEYREKQKVKKYEK